MARPTFIVIMMIARTNGLSSLWAEENRETGACLDSEPFDTDESALFQSRSNAACGHRFAVAEEMYSLRILGPAEKYHKFPGGCEPVTHVSRVINVNSIDDCAAACDKKSECGGFRTDGVKCYLKGQCGGDVAPCTGPWCSYRLNVVVNYDTLSGDCEPVTHVSGLINVSSIDDCAAACDKKSECGGFRTDGVKCYLKGQCGGDVAPCTGSWCSYRLKILKYETLSSGCNPNKLIEIVTTPNWDACAAECDNTAGCVAIGGDGLTCQLKSDCGGTPGISPNQWRIYRLKSYVNLKPTVTLKEAASTSRSDFLIGVGGLSPEKVGTQEAQALLTQHFNLATAGNVCKYCAIQKTQGSYTFGECDQIKTLAIDTMKGKFRLHALAWGNQNKQWLFDLSPEAKRQNLIDSIKKVVSHYGESSWAIDVVNEAIVDDIENNVPAEPFPPAAEGEHLKNISKLGGLDENEERLPPKEHPWYPDVPDYVDLSFKEARKSCSSCKLFYNDYNVEGAGGPIPRKIKADRMYEFVKGLQNRGVPIDGVGMQFHIHLEKSKRPSIAGMKENIERFAALGMEVHITEIDIKVPEDAWNAAKELEQAKLYAEILNVCYSIPECTAFTVWGLRDSDSWLLSREPVAAPLLFDDNYKPKLAVPYMIHVLQGKGITWQSVDA